MSYIGSQLERLDLMVDDRKGTVLNPRVYKVGIQFFSGGKKTNNISIEDGTLNRIFRVLQDEENVVRSNRRRGLRRNPLDSMRVYAGRGGFEITDFKKGDRIEMHPATDLWMRGARYGEIVQVGRKNLKVKLDYLRRAIAVSPRNIGQIVAREM